MIGRPATDDLRAITVAVFDFDGVFTDNTVYVAQDGSESVRCWRGDGIGLSRLRACGVVASVLSTETNPVVAARCGKLELDVVQGCTDKQAALEELLSRLDEPADHVCFVGNDVNDAGCLGLVGFPIVVADAHPDVVHLARYQTTAPGGLGAVREVCDLIAAARA